jgi:hypothetical protein
MQGLKNLIFNFSLNEITCVKRVIGKKAIHFIEMAVPKISTQKYQVRIKYSKNIVYKTNIQNRTNQQSSIYKIGKIFIKSVQKIKLTLKIISFPNKL